MPAYRRLISSKRDPFPERQDAEIWIILPGLKKKNPNQIYRWELSHNIPCRYYDLYSFSRTRNDIFRWKKPNKRLIEWLPSVVRGARQLTIEAIHSSETGNCL